MLYGLVILNLLISGYLAWRIRQPLLTIAPRAPAPPPKIPHRSTGISAFGAPPVGPLEGGSKIVAKGSELKFPRHDLALDRLRTSDRGFTPARAKPRVDVTAEQWAAFEQECFDMGQRLGVFDQEEIEKLDKELLEALTPEPAQAR